MKSDLGAEIVKVAKALYLKGLISASDGNISVRLSKDKILITPTGVFKGGIKKEQLVLIKLPLKEKVVGAPSKELKLHLAIYSIRPEINAIIHSHPLYLLLLAQKPLPGLFYQNTDLSKKDVLFLPYYQPGSKELASAVGKFLKESKVIVLKNHGLVVAGSSLKEAWFLTEKIERWAKFLYFKKISRLI